MPRVVTSAPSGSRLRAYWRVATPINIWSTTRRFSGSVSVKARAVGSGTSVPSRRARGRANRAPSARPTRPDSAYAPRDAPAARVDAHTVAHTRRPDPLPAWPRAPSGPTRRPAPGARPAYQRGSRPTEGAGASGIPIGDGEGTVRDCFFMAAPCWEALHLGFVTGRIATTSEEPPLQISTARGTSPSRDIR